MIGTWSAIVATSAGFGPPLGGIMVSAFGWRSVFLINLPIGNYGATTGWYAGASMCFLFVGLSYLIGRWSRGDSCSYQNSGSVRPETAVELVRNPAP